MRRRARRWCAPGTRSAPAGAWQSAPAPVSDACAYGDVSRSRSPYPPFLTASRRRGTSVGSGPSRSSVVPIHQLYLNRGRRGNAVRRRAREASGRMTAPITCPAERGSPISAATQPEVCGPNTGSDCVESLLPSQSDCNMSARPVGTGGRPHTLWMTECSKKKCEGVLTRRARWY